MVKIDPYFDKEPIELWQEASRKRNKSYLNPDRKSRIELALVQGGKHDFDRAIYGMTEVKSQLKVIFKGKCAFCETNTYVGAHKDVEHYRFKSHYYWLGYEWSNLLLSCQICNRDFKKIQFPLENEANRITTHPLSIKGEFDRKLCKISSKALINEQPLLLHPAVDNPKEHLQFSPNGTIQGLNRQGGKSVKGEISIAIYGLNREQLVKAREAIVMKIIKFITDIYTYEIEKLSDSEKQKWMKTVITMTIGHIKAKITDRANQYIAFREALLENFEAFVIDNLNFVDMPDKEIMRQAAREVLQN